jgi:electron transfer flavoprotein alpha subunit
MKKVAVFLENKVPNAISSVGLELISESRRVLGDSVVEIVGIWLGESLSALDQSRIQKAGANRLILVSHKDLFDYDTDRYARTLALVEQKEHFDVLLIGSSIIGRDLGPRLSAKLQTGLTADATKLDFDLSDDKLLLLATRPALGGNLFATIICPKTTPQMATIRPGVFRVSNEHNSHMKMESFEYVPVSSRVQIISSKPKTSESVDLTKAKLIVSGGRGVSRNYDLIKELASALDTEYASSRGLVDMGVTERPRLVGQTGSTVRPIIYLAFGISGAIQHLAGMDKSDMIIAVNNDESAPIFDVADIGIVGDANEILPLLIKRIKEYKENK